MNIHTTAKIRFVSIKDACEITSLSRTTIFLWERDDPSFPKLVSLSPDGIRKAFVEQEIQEWMASRIANRDEKGGA